MSNDSAIKAAEQRAYSRGYSAGRTRGRRDALEQPLTDQQFLDAAFLAALPICIQEKGWQTATGKPITNRMAKTELAMGFATDALKLRRRNPA